MAPLEPGEIVTLMQTIQTALGMLGQKNAVAGIILAHDNYDGVKALFKHEAKPYEVQGAILDPRMHNTFVVAGMLLLRGTK